MATKAAQKGGSKKPEEKYVTVERFNSLEGSVNKLVDLLEKQGGDKQTAPAEPKKPEAAKDAIRTGAPTSLPVNPEWENMAREIIGEAVDRCELQHLKNGGVIFTVVIRKDFSNAPAEYLQWYKEDRRSKEVGSEGIAGVETWCKLIKQNLSRPK